MSRERDSFDAWERKKNLLVQSMFHHDPPPVPEEDDSCSSIIRSPVLTPRRPPPPRAHSPLPDLIIEVEPNRHDEPEEFYVGLEKRMRKVYRKLFIEGKSDISNDSTDNEVVDMDCTPGVATSFEKVTNNYEINGNTRHGLKRTIAPDDKSEASKSKQSKSLEADRSSTATSRSTTDDVEQVTRVTFKADVHREATNTDYESDALPSTVEACVDEDLESSYGSTTLEKNTVSDNTHHDYSEHTEIEVLRSEPLRPSVGSLHNQDSYNTSSDDNISREEQPRLLERDTQSVSSRNETQLERDTQSVSSRNETQLERDTKSVSSRNETRLERDAQSVSSRNETQLERDTESTSSPNEISVRFRKNSTTSFSDSSSISYADAGTQTHFVSEDETRDILSDIFVGTPRVYNVCSCTNHTCRD